MPDYSDIQKVEIMKVGKWNGMDITAKDLRDAAAVYDPFLLKAPIVLDHIESGQAYGHILDLECIDPKSDKEDISLWATIGFFPEGEWMLTSGRWPERSVYIDTRYPTPGIPYIRHLSLLGAANPAVTGMKPVEEPNIDPSDKPEKEVPEPKEKEPAIPLQFMETILKDGYFIWDIKENWIRYRVRPPSRFRNGEDGTDDTFKTIWLSKEQGLMSVQGKLRKQYVPTGRDPESMVMQNVMFDKDKWDVSKAKQWVRDHEGKLEYNGVYFSHAVFDTGIILDKAVENMTETKTPEPVTPTPDPAPVETTQAQMHVEPGSMEAIQRENIELKKRLLDSETSRMNEAMQFNKTLHKSNKESRDEGIRFRCERLKMENYITPAYVEEGLKQIFDIIPDTAICEVRGKKIKAADALENILKLNGKLKIREDFMSKLASIEGSDDDEAAMKLAAKGAQGFDLDQKAKELMSADPKLSYDQALIRAEKLIGGAI